MIRINFLILVLPVLMCVCNAGALDTFANEPTVVANNNNDGVNIPNFPSNASTKNGFSSDIKTTINQIVDANFSSNNNSPSLKPDPNNSILNDQTDLYLTKLNSSPYEKYRSFSLIIDKQNNEILNRVFEYFEKSGMFDKTIIYGQPIFSAKKNDETQNDSIPSMLFRLKSIIYISSSKWSVVVNDFKYQSMSDSFDGLEIESITPDEVKFIYYPQSIGVVNHLNSSFGTGGGAKSGGIKYSANDRTLRFSLKVGFCISVNQLKVARLCNDEMSRKEKSIKKKALAGSNQSISSGGSVNGGLGGSSSSNSGFGVSGSVSSVSGSSGTFSGGFSGK